MEYITHRRFKKKAICGEVNIPALTVCECRGNILYHNGKPLCLATSENGHQFFAVNEDGDGMERGKLTQAIQKALAKKDKDHQKRWDKVWASPICQPYKRVEHTDYWLWNHEFFNADIETLKRIAKIVGVKGV